MATNYAPLPQSEDEFAQDPRVSFDKATQEWTLEDGPQSWNWLAKWQKWVPIVDEALVKQRMDMYKREGEEDEPVEVDPRKRKAEQQKAAAEAKKSKKEPRDRPNTAIYVTGIPLDADLEDISEVFNKAGLIEEDIHTGLPKIKMYADDRGDFSGHAKIIYFQAASVKIAIQRFDETDFKKGGQGSMRVEEADFSQSKSKEVSAETMVRKQKSKQDRFLAKQKSEQMKARLADWSDDEPSAINPTPNPSKYAKMVVVKHMFTLQELKEEPEALIDIKDDARTEAEKFGQVTNVVLYDEEEDGVVTIRFTEPESAEACAAAFSGRKFDGRVLIAYVPQHREQYRKSKSTVAFDIDEDDGKLSEDEEEDKENGDGAVESTEDPVLGANAA